MCKHYECVYYAPKTESCDYMLIMGTPRGCSPEECTKCRTNLDGVKPIIRGYRPRKIDMAAIHRMEKAYKPFMSQEELASVAHVPENMACQWVRKVHPEFVKVPGGYSWDGV